MHIDEPHYQMASDVEIEKWLEAAQIVLISELDVLVFIYRHGASLASAAQIALLLGHEVSMVGKALEKLEIQGIVRRSQSARGVRFYRLALSGNSLTHQNVEALLKLSEHRSGRLLLVNMLRKRALASGEPEAQRLALGLTRKEQRG